MPGQLAELAQALIQEGNGLKHDKYRLGCHSDCTMCHSSKSTVTFYLSCTLTLLSTAVNCRKSKKAINTAVEVRITEKKGVQTFKKEHLILSICPKYG